ncbi:hypothetical protein ABCR94_19465 [Streptomyces sp. 21So2-11]|uniref:hypothetical protein n=1 Tax=Streptomyces sp. 21So2-11 TaxID=3144408 RepID=UPI00321AF3A9
MSDLWWSKRRSEWKRERGPWELREEIRAKAGELRSLLEAKRDLTEQATPEPRLEKALDELTAAEDAVSYKGHRRCRNGSHVAVAQIHLNTARSLWLRMTSPVEVVPYLPGLLAVVREHLAEGDTHRIRVEDIVKKIETPGRALNETDCVAIIEAVDAARGAALREKLRVGSFVRIVRRVTCGLTLLVVLVAVFTAIFSMAVPLCFQPLLEPEQAEKAAKVGYSVVCPLGSKEFPEKEDIDDDYKDVVTWGDYIVIEAVGLVAAGIAAALALRKSRGTATAYPIPVALALLKLPTGALTAVFGLLLMRGGFVPGLSALDTSAQIIAWAIIFGYSQELFTKFVDKQGQTVLDAVRGPTIRPPAQQPES